jgi:hypothetical protein
MISAGFLALWGDWVERLFLRVVIPSEAEESSRSFHSAIAKPIIFEVFRETNGRLRPDSSASLGMTTRENSLLTRYRFFTVDSKGGARRSLFNQ